MACSLSPLFSKNGPSSESWCSWSGRSSRGRRTVTAALRQMGQKADPRFSRYHQVFNRASWSLYRASWSLYKVIDTPRGLKPHGFSVLRRGQRHASPKGLPGPLYVSGSVMVAVQTRPAVRAFIREGSPLHPGQLITDFLTREAAKRLHVERLPSTPRPQPRRGPLERSQARGAPEPLLRGSNGVGPASACGTIATSSAAAQPTAATPFGAQRRRQEPATAALASLGSMAHHSSARRSVDLRRAAPSSRPHERSTKLSTRKAERLLYEPGLPRCQPEGGEAQG